MNFFNYFFFVCLIINEGLNKIDKVSDYKKVFCRALDSDKQNSAYYNCSLKKRQTKINSNQSDY